MERVAAAFGHHELVQNPEDARTLTNRLKVPPRKVTILGNGIDLLRFNGDRQQRVAVRAEWGFGDHHFVVGVVGRLVREKGFDEVVIAAELLHSTSPHIRLVVIGPDDPDKSDGVTAASISDAKSRGVHFVGQRDDMPACYAAMDLYVTASHREGFPRAAMEAAASGLPIVATDIRGCRQVVDHGVTGVLVPARDPAALASAVASLARDPAALARMGAAGAAKAATEFDQQGVIDVTLRTYQRLLTARGYSVSPLN